MATSAVGPTATVGPRLLNVSEDDPICGTLSDVGVVRLLAQHGGGIPVEDARKDY